MTTLSEHFYLRIRLEKEKDVLIHIRSQARESKHRHDTKRLIVIKISFTIYNAFLFFSELWPVIRKINER